MGLWKSVNEALEPIFKPAENMIAGVNPAAWNSPNQPLRPLMPPGLGIRTWDLQPGINLQYLPRGDSSVNFRQLANFANSFDLVRLLIETRKDQIVNRPWAIKVKSQPGESQNDRLKREKSNPNVAMLTKALAKPDGVHPFPTWIRMWLEDLLVFDAPCILPMRNMLGDPLPGGLRLISGSTITPLVDNQGFIPAPPDPAYQQIILGLPTANLASMRGIPGSPSNPNKFLADQLIYSPRNPRINSRWGFGPVEQIIQTIQIGSHWQYSTKAYFTEGNVPEGFMPMPETWTMKQITDFQNWFDGLLAGHIGKKRRMIAIPDTKREAQFPKLASIIDPVVNEYLIRLCAFAFSISPQNLLKQINRGTAKESSDVAQMEGLEPYLKHIENTINYDIISGFYGIEDCEMSYQDEREVDPVKQAQVDVQYVNSGIYTRDEIREARGDDPLGVPQGAIPGITTTQGFVPLTQPVGLPEPGTGGDSGKPSSKQEQPPAAVEHNQSSGER
jgi:hypothetical protein